MRAEEPMTLKTDMEEWITSAAEAAGYRDGFGVSGCDLTSSEWWAAYCRQSTEQQRSNNRVPEYLLTCAKEAKRLGVVIPREYILYDAVSGEHLERPGMEYLRKELVPGRKIAGVIFPALDRLSREPIHIGVFEFELDYCGISYHYADAPNGSDPMSQMMRQNLAHIAKFVKLVNRKNNRAGNVGRVLKGMVPALRASYGYSYHAEYTENSGRRSLIRSWWEIDQLDEGAQPVYASPAWVVQQVFRWIGEEERTLYWAAIRLNELEIRSAEGRRWSPGKLQHLIGKKCYTGKHAYNVTTKVPSGTRPLLDVTAEIKRTRVQQKPESEWVHFEVPSIISETQWEKANKVLRTRGRGRGKKGRSIQALLRGRIFCPRCGIPMLVRRAGRDKNVYYHCKAYFRPWLNERCSFRRFIPASWDEVIWTDVCSLLREDTWLVDQMTAKDVQRENTAGILKQHRSDLSRAKSRIAKIQEGYEGGIYSLEQAKARIARFKTAIEEAEEAISVLEHRSRTVSNGVEDIKALTSELNRLRDSNLDEANFEQRVELISTLGVKVYPAEDLSTTRVQCRINPGDNSADPGTRMKAVEARSADHGRDAGDGCAKVVVAPPNHSNVLTKTPGTQE